MVCLVIAACGVMLSSGAAILISDPSGVTPSSPDYWENSFITIGRAEVIVNGGTVITQPAGANVTIGSGEDAVGRLTITENARMYTPNSAYVGYRGGTGIMTIENGGTWMLGSSMFLGQNEGTTGILSVSTGGTVTVGGLSIGLSGHGIINISNGGTLVNTSSFTTNLGSGIYSTPAVGVVVVDGAGSNWINNSAIKIAMGGVSTGSLTVRNGGLVATTGLSAGDGVADLEFDGGVLRAQGASTNFITGVFNSLKLTGAGMTLENDQAVTVNQTFTGDGGLRKTGVGTLTLNAKQEYTGLTVVESGTLTGTVSLTGGLVVRNGGVFAPGGASKGWQAEVGGFVLDRGGILALKIGVYRDSLLVDGDVVLDGTLALSAIGTLRDGDSYALIVNDGNHPVYGTFSTITVGGASVEWHPVGGLFGGGWFEYKGKTFAISYGGDASTGSLYGGRDVVLGVGVDVSVFPPVPPIPEPATLTLLALGATIIYGCHRGERRRA